MKPWNVYTSLQEQDHQHFTYLFSRRILILYGVKYLKWRDVFLIASGRMIMTQLSEKSSK